MRSNTHQQEQKKGCGYDVNRKHSLALSYFLQLSLRSNNSFKPKMFRGGDFCGSVYHNASPLRISA